MNEFKAHGYMGINNSSAMEIEISDTGEAVRVRCNDKVSRWLMVSYNCDGSAYFRRFGRRYRLDEFMRI